MIDRATLVVVADETALATRVAQHTIETGIAAIARHGRFDLALAGGSTPKAAYAHLAGEPLRSLLDWTRVRFFFGDERCVPPDDDQSNYKMARLTMLEPLGIAPSAVFRMHGEDDPAVAASAYADILRSECALDETETPRLDLIMLGMGTDGHTASLFPGTDPREDDDLLVKSVYVEKLQTHRITLTPRVLNAAYEVAVATAGPSKTDALGAVLRGPYLPSTYPSQILEPRAGTLTWLVDAAAAARLS